MVPWSAFWERNAFARLPFMAEWLGSAFVRGAVTGIGIITAAAGLAELAGAFGYGRRGERPEQPGTRDS